MQVCIVVIVYNLSSEIFLLQMAAIKKFCKDDFVVKVFDNSDDMHLSEHIQYHAEQSGLDYCKIFSSSRNSSDSHSWASNFAYQKLKNDFRFFFFLDHDCIPTIDFSVVEILNGGHVMAGLGQGALKTYFWAGMVMFDTNRVDKDDIDFSTNSTYGLDTGGNLYIAIEKYGKENCIFFNEAYHQNPYFKSKNGSTYATINNGMFLHCVAASNWRGDKRHEERINTLINIIREKTGI